MTSTLVDKFSRDPVPGLFEADGAASALRDFLQEVRTVQRIGINRFDLNKFPEVMDFLYEAIREYPRRVDVLCSIAQISQYGSTLEKAGQTALKLVDRLVLADQRTIFGRTQL